MIEERAHDTKRSTDAMARQHPCVAVSQHARPIFVQGFKHGRSVAPNRLAGGSSFFVDLARLRK
jgi:hypothetical protein